jgi:hypothetical protein
VDDLQFSSIPRDILEPKNVVTILLREQFRTFQIPLLPLALVQRNPDIKGRLRALRVKHFSPQDKSQRGDSKENWRLGSETLQILILLASRHIGALVVVVLKKKWQ